jgi:hypothetical protein
MRCQEIGVFVREGELIRSGDLYACSVCTESVIADFGAPFGERDAPQLYARVSAALGSLPYISRQTLQERF